MNFRSRLMHDAPITREIRAIRRALASQFDNDILQILADVRSREASDGRTYVRLPRREPHRLIAAEQSEAAERE